jgi:hypothetical protein
MHSEIARPKKHKSCKSLSDASSPPACLQPGCLQPPACLQPALRTTKNYAIVPHCINQYNNDVIGTRMHEKNANVDVNDVIGLVKTC